MANANNDNDLWRGVGKGRIAVFDELVVLPMHSMRCILTVVALALRSHAYLHMVWLKDPQNSSDKKRLMNPIYPKPAKVVLKCQMVTKYLWQGSAKLADGGQRIAEIPETRV